MPIRRWTPIALALTLPCLAPGPAADSPPPPGWKLTWSDEFLGDRIDRAKWGFDLGRGFQGWGNDELQSYTDDPANAFVEAGQLHVRAIEAARDGARYTSARLVTAPRGGPALFSQAYGRFEFRARLPTGRGLWPALWMLPVGDPYGGWAASGEIDLMEARGQEPGKVLGTIHHGSGWPGNLHEGADYRFPAGQSIADFHVYALEWEPGELRWSVDNTLYQTRRFWWSSPRRDARGGLAPATPADLAPWPAPFDRPFYLIINLAVGGQFLGNPDKSTPFPAELVVDYVRVYEKVGGYGPIKLRGPGKLPFETR